MSSLTPKAVEPKELQTDSQNYSLDCKMQKKKKSLSTEGLQQMTSEKEACLLLYNYSVNTIHFNEPMSYTPR